MTQVFISYSSKDAMFADFTETKLNKAGVNVWLDHGELLGGDEWRESIDQGISSSDVILVILTPNSCESPYVTYEWGYALGQGKKVIPMLREDMKIHPRLELIQYLDFRDHRSGPWDKLIHRILENKSKNTCIETSSLISDLTIEEFEKLMIDSINESDKREIKVSSISVAQNFPKKPTLDLKSDFQKVIDHDTSNNMRWLEESMNRARAVALVSYGPKPTGSGFVLKGSDINPKLGDELFLLTSTSVTSSGNSDRIDIQKVHVSFTGMNNDVNKIHDFGVTEIIWSSPIHALDTTIMRLDKPIEGIDPYPIALELPDLEIKQRVIIIGHPKGGELAFSLADNLLLDQQAPMIHYRAPTEPGSAGSPVFNENFELIAIHHARRKVDGVDVSEGIAFLSIIEAVAKSLA